MFRLLSKILRLSEDLPMIVETLDRDAAIHACLPALDEMVEEGSVTLEKVNTVKQRHREGGKP